jgi:hypothetical protein
VLVNGMYRVLNAIVGGYRSIKFVGVCSMKGCRGRGGTAPFILISEVDRNEWLASRIGSFTSRGGKKKKLWHALNRKVAGCEIDVNKIIFVEMTSHWPKGSFCYCSNIMYFNYKIRGTCI